MATKKVATSLDLLLNELKNFKVGSLSAKPTQVTEGQLFYCTEDKTLYYGTDNKWNPIATGGSVGDSVSSALKSLSLALDGTTLNLEASGANVGSADLESLKGFVSASLLGKNSSNVTAKTAGYNLKFTETTDIEFDSTEFAKGNVKPTIKRLSADKIADFSVEISGNNMTFYGGTGNLKKTLHTLNIASLAQDGMQEGVALLTATGTMEKVTVNQKEYTVSGLTIGRTYIVFVWNTVSGKQPMALDVTTLVNVYTPGDGLALNNGKFSVKLGGQDEGYLTTDGNGYLITQGITNKITTSVNDAKVALAASIDGLDTSLGSAETRITGAEKAIQKQGTSLATLTTRVTNVESAYTAGDTALLGASDDSTEKVTIYGVRNYATDVAKEAHGYKLQKTVASGHSTPLWANRTNPNATADETGYEVDKSSIVVLWKFEEIEVQIAHKAAGPVTVSWSGIEPTSNSPLVIQYRVIAKKS